MSPTTSSLVNIPPVHHSLGLHQMEGPPAKATPFNVPRHVLPWSPLAPIGEHPQVTGFAPPSSSTPYEPLMREPPPRVPNCIPLSRSPQHLYGAVEQDDPLTFGDAAHTVTQGSSTFREPYPVA